MNNSLKHIFFCYCHRKAKTPHQIQWPRLIGNTAFLNLGLKGLPHCLHKREMIPPQREIRRLNGTMVWNCWDKEEAPFSRTVEDQDLMLLFEPLNAAIPDTRSASLTLAMMWISNFILFSLIHFELDFGHWPIKESKMLVLIFLRFCGLFPIVLSDVIESIT